MLKQTLNLSRAIQNVSITVKIYGNTRSMAKRKGHSTNDRVPGNKKEEAASAAIFTTSNEPDNLILLVNIKPGAKKNAVTDFSNTDGLGVQIHAPPRDGEANKELIKYLSEILRVKKSSLVIQRGSKSRNKVISITDTCLTIDDVKSKIEKELKD